MTMFRLCSHPWPHTREMTRRDSKARRRTISSQSSTWRRCSICDGLGLYPVRVIGHELRSRGIHAGDILIANAAAEPVSGKVCVAFLKGEVILATLTRKDEGWWLKPSTSEPLPVSGDVEIWAIISALVRMKV